MAEISRTTNLDKFRQQFNQIGDKNEATIEKRNGESFVVKGRGKSKLGRLWFSCKHLVKPNKAVRVQNRNVVRALKSAAKKDFGDKGLALVAKYFQSKGLKNDTALTKADVTSSVNTVKIHKELADFQKKLQVVVENDLKKKMQQLENGNLSKFEIGQLKRKIYGLQKKLDKGVMKSSFSFNHVWAVPSGRRLLEALGNKALTHENTYFFSAREEFREFLKSDATIGDKRAAFRNLANAYVKDGADLQVNFSFAARKRVIEVANNPKATIQDMRVALRNAHGSLSKLIPDVMSKFKKIANDPDSFSIVDLADKRRKQGYVGGRDTAKIDGYIGKMPKSKPKPVVKKKKVKVKKEKPEVRLEADKPAPKLKVDKPMRKAKADGPEPVIKREKAPKKAPDPHAKLKKVLNRTSGIKNHPQLKNLTNAELNDFNEMFSDDTELSVINKVKQVLREKAKKAGNANV